MERKILGIIKHKSKEEIILKDQNNIEWRLTDIKTIYEEYLSVMRSMKI